MSLASFAALPTDPHPTPRVPPTSGLGLLGYL
ncbi:uncharacterized protein METZ01_LOCUS158882, partial [marine metagenome]